MRVKFIYSEAEVIINVRRFNMVILILILFHQILSAQSMPIDSMSRGGTMWLSTCSPDTISPRICLFGTDLPESCSISNRSAAVFIRWYDNITDSSFEYLADSLVESTRKSTLQSDPNPIIIQDTSVGKFRTIL